MKAAGWAALLAILAPSAPAAATDLSQYYTPAYQDCAARANGEVGPMRGCTLAEFRHWDREVGAAYSARLARAPERARARIKADQKAWLGARQTRCMRSGARAGAESEDDVVQLVSTDDCFLGATVARALQLGLR